MGVKPPPTAAGPRLAHSHTVSCKHAAQRPLRRGWGGGCRAAWGRVGCSTTHGADTKNPTLASDKIKSHQPCNRNHPTQTTKRGTVSLLQYSEGEAGVAGRAVAGWVGWDRQNKNTWRAPRVKKRAEEEKKNTPAPHHHLRLPPRAPSPLHRCHAPRKRTLLFIS